VAERVALYAIEVCPCDSDGVVMLRGAGGGVFPPPPQPRSAPETSRPEIKPADIKPPEIKPRIENFMAPPEASDQFAFLISF
jgi:hypothetical protein